MTNTLAFCSVMAVCALVLFHGLPADLRIAASIALLATQLYVALTMNEAHQGKDRPAD
jgi:hypothetical protein